MPMPIAIPTSAIPPSCDNPVAQLISPEHAAAIRAAILPDRATPSSEVKGGVVDSRRA